MSFVRKYTSPEQWFEDTCKDGAGPAFPFVAFGYGMEYTFSGMTRREYHASKMMAARLAMGYGERPDKAAEAAVAFADALIQELDKDG